MVPHIDYIEQIYFAGGEPLIMQEHYNILKELVKRERFDVKLIYNTNFNETMYKDLDVLEYWKLFDSVSIGASLDASGARAELMRKGSNWDKTVRNRIRMLTTCPNVDFYIKSNLIGPISIIAFPFLSEVSISTLIIDPKSYAEHL